MSDYMALRVDADPCTEDITDLIAAHLADAGYESFEADGSGVTAYVNAADFSDDKAREALRDFEIPTSLSLSHELIQGQDWNAEWEKHYFTPIVIDDRCVVHSSFHTDIPKCDYDIVVDPKMAFGTGHHSTTNLMLRYLLTLTLDRKSLIDMGTGTAILAILAAMRGAHPVTGIEIDPDAYTNALENVEINHVDARMLKGDASRLGELEPVDFFLANINRNIILADLPAYRKCLKSGGEMILSGFYKGDLPMVEAAAMKHGLLKVDFMEDNDWVAARFRAS